MWIGVGELAEVVVFRLLQGRRQALHRWSRQRHLLHQLQLQLRFLLQLQQRSRQHQPQELQRAREMDTVRPHRILLLGRLWSRRCSKL